MPEYLSPGVFIEEVPSGLKAIEGVSTSTAAFVGRARRGTVPGYRWPDSGTPGLPFTPTDGFVLSPDPAPVLVTSFAEFQRQFGTPWPLPLASDPNDYGYLGWAVRAFFDNGGKRIYVARIVDPANTLNPGDTPSWSRAAQGVVYRLVRSAAIGDGAAGKPLHLSSTRGLNVSDTITFRRHADGANALGAPVSAARATGSAVPAPFALTDGDQLDVVTNTPAATVSASIVAKPATVQTSGAAPFAVPDNATLLLRVGPPTEPLQTLTFSTADPDAPITLLPGASLDEVEAVISRYASGVRVFQKAGQVVIETDVHGTAARLEIVGGSAAGPLGLALGVASPPPGGNVPDAAHVTIPQLAVLLSSPNFSVDDDGAGHLRFTTTAVGGTVTIQLNEQPVGSKLLERLGFGAVSSVTESGATGVPPTVQIASYDVQSNSVTLTAPLPVRLDANAVYAVVSAPTTAVGPKFVARSPGSWGAEVSVAIANADRSPTQVTGPVAVGSATLPVQSVSSLYVGAIVEVDHNSVGRSIHQVKAINPSTRVLTLDPPLPAPALSVVVNPLTDKPAWIRTMEVDVTIADASGVTEVYRGLSWNRSAGADLRRHYAWQINARSRLVWVQPPGIGKPLVDQLSGTEEATLASQPATPDGFPMKLDQIGIDSFNDLDDTWLGADNGPGQRSGIESLKDLSEARIIAAPGKTSQTIQLALIAQCELLRYRFAILDGELAPQAGSVNAILTHRNLYDTSFAAYYQPWVTVIVDGQNRDLPASGYLAGIYARVDNARGVWKAPANETVLNVTGLKTRFTTGEQDLLNPRGVNLIRQFDTGGIRVWGARTLSSDPDVKYINVRRTLIFLEASIDRGTQWVVFEPNAPETWSRLTSSVSSFLHTQWRDGALFGRSPEEAFFVRCDESTMTADDILNGRLICQIGVAIVRPAEFVIFRIEQITNFGQSS